MTGQGPRRRNAVTLAVLGILAIGMVGMAFASVPLYRMFCQATGLGGTTQRGGTAENISTRTIIIRFDGTVEHNLPWHFAPTMVSMKVHLGETALATFHAENLSNETITGQAAYNVSPDKAGLYFHKIQCFCFNQQTLKPHQAVDMPVTFYVDPDIVKDADLAGADTIILSYNFFRSSNPLDETPAMPYQGSKPHPAANGGVD